MSCNERQVKAENLQAQLLEIETLQAIYANPGELQFDDSFQTEQIERFINNQSDDLPPYIDFTLNLKISDEKVEVSFNLCHEYPQIDPEVYIRSNKLSRSEQQILNQDCCEFMKSLPKSEPQIYNIINWVEENALKYVETQCDDDQLAPLCKEESECKLIRMWIYSHHIYNKTKRREILNLAHGLKLTGFCMPGKPGVICIEGNATDCNTWWTNIRSMSWQKILCKVTEDCKTARFSKFEEVCFVNPSTNHANLGELKKYLEEYDLGFIFKELFGFEAK